MLDIKKIGNPNLIIGGVIIFLILFALIYLYQNRKQNEKFQNGGFQNKGMKGKTIEGFEQYNVNAGDTVKLNSLDNVLVGNDNKNLSTAINEVIQGKKSDLLQGYVQSSELGTFQNTINSQIAALPSSDDINNSIDSKISPIQTDINDTLSGYNGQIESLRSDIQHAKDDLTNIANSAAPPLSIIAYYGDTAPIGWQICDGSVLLGMDGQPVTYGTGTSSVPIKTPQLSGRVIVGSTGNNNTPIPDINGRALSTYEIGVHGGEEQHKLQLWEMPAHSHSATYRMNNYTNSAPTWGFNGADYSSAVGWTNNTGGDPSMTNKLQDPTYPNDATKKINDTASHNNMQPFYVLMYIIKQPVNGGKILDTKPFNLYSPSAINTTTLLKRLIRWNDTTTA